MLVAGDRKTVSNNNQKKKKENALMCIWLVPGTVVDVRPATELEAGMVKDN